MGSKMTIVNLTPHAITLQVGDVTTTFQPSGTVARVTQTTQPNGLTVAGGQVHTSIFGDVLDIPPPQKNTYYVVSGLVLGALNGSRPDVIAPKTDNTAIRNDKGHIVAVTGWLQ